MTDEAATKYVSPNGYSDAYGPNVANILAHGSRTITSRIPAQVRRELAEAVRDGVLGHMKKDGLKPEIFFHPRHRASAVEVREREVAYAIACVAKVCA